MFYFFEYIVYLYEHLFIVLHRPYFCGRLQYVVLEYSRFNMMRDDTEVSVFQYFLFLCASQTFQRVRDISITVVSIASFSI